MFGVSCALILVAPRSSAFALLGPYESWMVETNGFRQPGDIGGPMCISNGYRWNVPVVTYGFDQSFLDYFGTNGVAAVDNAIQILNDVPPASQIVLANYPFNSQAVNYTADAQYLLDLKSATLTLLLEQMGLTQPIRNVYALKQWDPIFLTSPGEYQWPEGTVPNNIVIRNFDPASFAPSQYVNGSLFVGLVINGAQDGFGGRYNLAFPLAADPSISSPSVADCGFDLSSYSASFLSSGLFFTGLTKDDVGGLCYLLSTNNIAYETLLPGISSVCTNSPVNGAWRPGVDKITFVPQPFDSLLGQFLPMTNQFTDTYITSGVVTCQQLQRVTTQPDILFCAGDVNYGISAIPYVDRTGTTNWLNNALLNGNPTNGGPGVMQPGVKITFNKLGPEFYNSTDESAIEYSSFVWSTFDGSTNNPIVYPATQIGTSQFTIRMWLIMGNPVSLQKHFDWKLTNPAGSVAVLQTSTNLANWVTLFSATNNSSVYTFMNYQPSATARYYRVIPQ
jgi:hypothetical protein